MPSASSKSSLQTPAMENNDLAEDILQSLTKKLRNMEKRKVRLVHFWNDLFERSIGRFDHRHDGIVMNMCFSLLKFSFYSQGKLDLYRRKVEEGKELNEDQIVGSFSFEFSPKVKHNNLAENAWGENYFVSKIQLV